LPRWVSLSLSASYEFEKGSDLFSSAVMERSRALLERVEGMAVLEEFGELMLDCADGEAWLAMLVRRTS
jgi:hypothetical protein